jgi:hypothetical protein
MIGSVLTAALLSATVLATLVLLALALATLAALLTALILVLIAHLRSPLVGSFAHGSTTPPKCPFQFLLMCQIFARAQRTARLRAALLLI